MLVENERLVFELVDVLLSLLLHRVSSVKLLSLHNVLDPLLLNRGANGVTLLLQFPSLSLAVQEAIKRSNKAVKDQPGDAFLPFDP